MVDTALVEWREVDSASLAVGGLPLLAALLSACCGSRFTGLTHYGTAPVPILSAGHAPLRTRWRTCAVIGVGNIAIWLVRGGL